MPEESTTPDLVELTRQAFDAANRGELDAMMSFLAPHAVFEATALGVSFEGVAAVRGVIEDWMGSYDQYDVEAQEIRDIGNGVVFAATRRHARLTGSVGHAPLRGVIFYVLAWEDGVVVRASAYGDIDEARAAAERLAQERG